MRPGGGFGFSGTAADLPEDEADVFVEASRRRQHLEMALIALRYIIQQRPRLSSLMASGPALAPLLNCVDPICRYFRF